MQEIAQSPNIITFLVFKPVLLFKIIANETGSSRPSLDETGKEKMALSSRAALLFATALPTRPPHFSRREKLR
jgi:hypothetical protein